MPETTRPDPADGSVLGPFLGFLAEYKALLAAMVGLGAATAVGSLVTSLGPPWPGPLAVASLTGVAAMVLLAWTFLTSRRRDDASYVRRMRVAVALAAGLAVAYFALSALLTYDTKAGPVVGGFVVRPEVLDEIRQDGSTVGRALAEAECDPGRIWTRASLTLALVAFLAAWVGFFGAVSAVLATLLLALEAQKANRGERPWGEAPGP